MDKWIVEYTLLSDNKKYTAYFSTREEAEIFIDETSEKCSEINLRYDWGI